MPKTLSGDTLGSYSFGDSDLVANFLGGADTTGENP